MTRSPNDPPTERLPALRRALRAIENAPPLTGPEKADPAKARRAAGADRKAR